MSKYIVLEGIDGSGKSTICQSVMMACYRAGLSADLYPFPSPLTVPGELIRNIIDGKLKVTNPKTMAWLFIADAIEVEDAISESLREEHIVIADRHPRMSGLAYQSVVYSEYDLEKLINVASFHLPNKIFLIDVPAVVALERRSLRGKSQSALYEDTKVAKVESLRGKYLALRDRWPSDVVTTIDGRRSLDSIVDEIMAYLTGGQ